MNKAPYVDHLKAYMEIVVTHALEENNLPDEFAGIPRSQLINELISLAVPTLRMFESRAVSAAIEVYAAGIRFARKQQEVVK